MAQAPAARSSVDMVLIGCKHPSGLILNLDRYQAKGTQGQVDRVPGGATVTLKGWARPLNGPNVRADETEGGYQLTAVPHDFWDAWFAIHKEDSLIVDRVILPPASDTAAMAREFSAVPQMFRPADPADKSADRIVPGIEPGERQDRAA